MPGVLKPFQFTDGMMQGRVGAQYIEDTAEVRAAKERFHKFFQLVLAGLLGTLAPEPGRNVLPAEIADLYIEEDAEVAAARRSFDQLYRAALAGHLPPSQLQEAVKDHEADIEAAGEELERTIADLEDLVEAAEADNDIESFDDDYDL